MLDAASTSHLISIMGIGNCLGRILFGKALDVFRSGFATNMSINIIVKHATAVSDYDVFNKRCFKKIGRHY